MPRRMVAKILATCEFLLCIRYCYKNQSYLHNVLSSKLWAHFNFTTLSVMVIGHFATVISPLTTTNLPLATANSPLSPIEIPTARKHTVVNKPTLCRCSIIWIKKKLCHVFVSERWWWTRDPGETSSRCQTAGKCCPCDIFHEALLIKLSQLLLLMAWCQAICNKSCWWAVSHCL